MSGVSGLMGQEHLATRDPECVAVTEASCARCMPDTA